jgi:hypothetical protein
MDGVIEFEVYFVITGTGSRAEENPTTSKPAKSFT